MMMCTKPEASFQFSGVMNRYFNALLLYINHYTLVRILFNHTIMIKDEH